MGGIFLRQVKNERLSGWDVHLKITLDGIRSRNPRNMLNKMCKFPPTQKKKIVKVSKICDFIQEHLPLFAIFGVKNTQ